MTGITFKGSSLTRPQQGGAINFDSIGGLAYARLDHCHFELLNFEEVFALAAPVNPDGSGWLYGVDDHNL